MSKEVKIDREVISLFISDYIGYDELDNNIFICGSYKRGLSKCSDIDMILISNEKPFTSIYDRLNYEDSISDLTIVRGDLICGTHVQLSFNYKTDDYGSVPIVLDMKATDRIKLPYATLHYTGSQFLNIAMRSIAKKKGYKLNEYGLFNIDNPELDIVHSEEKGIFEDLGYNYIDPELRSCVDIPSAFNLLERYKIK